MDSLGHRKLRQYLAVSGLKATKLAGLANITKYQLSHLTTGRRRASFAVAFALEEATNGAVKAHDWLKQ